MCRSGSFWSFLQVLVAASVLLVGCGGGNNDTGGDPTLSRLEIEPAAPSLAKGSSLPLQVMAIRTDGGKTNVTSQVQWTSTTPSIATVSNTAPNIGRLTAVSVGSTTIAASLQGSTVSATVTVTPAVPVSVAISPASADLPNGTALNLVATATFSDSTTQDVTEDTDWSSSNAAVIAVSNADGTRGRATATAASGTANIVADYGTLSATAVLTATAAVVDRIEIEPTAVALAQGTSGQLEATAIFTDGTRLEVTSEANWTSDAPGTATVGNDAGIKGRVVAVAVGDTLIRADYMGATGTSAITVNPVVIERIEVAPTSASAAKGTQKAFTATAFFNDLSQQDVTAEAIWSSSNTAVATVSNADGSAGVAQAVAEGTADITATYQSQTDSAALTVTAAILNRIEVTPALASIPLGSVQPYIATGVFTDGSTQPLTGDVTWSADAPDVVDISNAEGNKGLAVGSTVGDTLIRATLGDISGSTSVTVTAAVLTALQVTPTNANLAVDFRRQLRAFGRYSDSTVRDVTTSVTWATNDSSLATISNAPDSRGVATGVAAGTVSISAQLSGVTGSTLLNVTDATLTALQVTPGPTSLPVGSDRQFVAIGTFSDSSVQVLTEQVTWSSADPAIATITAAGPGAGFATAVAVGGPIDITASRDAISGTAGLTVTDAVLVSISVSPPTQSTPKGLTQQFTATGTYSDDTSTEITDTVTWSSSDNATATISNADGSEGLATAEAVGTVTVQASADGITGDAQLTVTDAVLLDLSVTPATASVALGVTQAFQATGTYSDSSTRDLTGDVAWTSDNESVATISNADDTAGQASTHAVGTITVTASTEGASDTAQLEVTAAALQTIVIAPMDATLPAGTTRQLTATGTYSDGTTENLTTTVTWSTSDPAVAEVSNGEESRGVALGKTVGAVTATATDPVSGVVGTAPLTVTSALLQAIVITPASATLPTGFGQQYTATGQFSDGVFRDVTTQVSWSTINPAVANVDNSLGRKGFVTAVSPGSTSAVANLNGVSTTTSVSVADIALTSIDVTPKDQAFSAGESLQFTAVGTFADDSTLELTRQVVWSSSNVNAARISNAEGSEGLATAGSTPATTAITATRGDVNGSTTLRRRLF